MTDQAKDENSLIDDIVKRSRFISDCVELTLTNSAKDVNEVVKLFLYWMENNTIVRVLGAGRARLAASMPANRLAHGGARVFMQNDIMPMPHTVRGGALLAASASGRTASVLEILHKTRKKAPHIKIVGIASSKAEEFGTLCDCFIGIEQITERECPIAALADIGEHVISQVLDALIVAAGRKGEFDNRRWQLGHENLGDSGPYDYTPDDVDLLFTDL